MPRYLRPLFARGIGPFRWIALSGDPADLDVLDELAVEVTDRPEVADWIALARRARRAAGPAGPQLLARSRRAVRDGPRRRRRRPRRARCAPRCSSPATTSTPPA